MNRATVVGTIGIDLIARGAGSADARASLGNSGGNIAIRLASLGWDVDLIALVGDDLGAEIVLNTLGAGGVRTDGGFEERRCRDQRRVDREHVVK